MAETGTRGPRLPWPLRLYGWATERLYHEWAWGYDAIAWLVSLGQWSRWRRAALAHVRGPRVLELGFGTGTLLLEMAHRGWQVCGLDSSPEMQRVAARKLSRRGVRVPRLRGYAQALPFAAGSLDSIVSTFPAGYILSPATWREVARTLRPADPVRGTPGGRMVIAGLSYPEDSLLARVLAKLLRSGPSTAPMLRLERLAAEVGLALTVAHEEGQGNAPLVLILERLPR